MRHTDILLRQFRDNDVEENREQKEKQSYLDDLQTEMRQLQELLNSPGWAIFVDRAKEEELAILRAIETTQDATSLARFTGSLLATKSHQTWAEDRLQMVERTLAQVMD